MLRIHCQLSSVAWDLSPLNILPSIEGWEEWDDVVPFSPVSPRAVYCEQGLSESVLLFVFKGQFIFNLTQNFFSSSLAHILSSL